MIQIPFKGEELRLEGGHVYVRSRSHPEWWYDVTYDSCQCPLFTFRRSCRHTRVVSDWNRYQALARKAS